MGFKMTFEQELVLELHKTITEINLKQHDLHNHQPLEILSDIGYFNNLDNIKISSKLKK
jgi:hypothetical protein